MTVTIQATIQFGLEIEVPEGASDNDIDDLAWAEARSEAGSLSTDLVGVDWEADR